VAKFLDGLIAPPLGWSVRRSRGVALVHVSGEIDLSNAGEVEERLASLPVCGTRAIVVDVSGTTFMDTNGVDALLRAQRAARARGQELCVVHPRGIVARLFDILGLERSLVSEAGGCTPC
jgi:anti-sigma B factor antagonist